MNGGTMKNDTKRSRLPLAAGLILFAAAALWALTRSFGVPAEALYVGYALFVGRAGYRIGSAPEAARQRPERCRRE